MPSEHARKWGHMEHSARAGGEARAGGFKLFGVQIEVSGGENGGVSSIRRSKSLGNLDSCSPEKPAAGDLSGYQSDGLVHQSSKSFERRKGRPWSEEEHRSFLIGLEKLGKGDWKGIATNFVPTRNSSQVASHAQKYFIRKSTTEKKRRRQSVFDIPLTEVNPPSQVASNSQPDKDSESSQPVKSWANSTTNISELKGLATTIPSVVASERPPLSPMRRRGVPSTRSMLYSSRVSGLSQSFSAQAIRPSIAWVPFVTFSNPNSDVFQPSTHGALAPACAKFVGHPSIAKFPQSTQRETPQVRSVVSPAAANDELNLNIRKLTL